MKKSTVTLAELAIIYNDNPIFSVAYDRAQASHNQTILRGTVASIVQNDARARLGRFQLDGHLFAACAHATSKMFEDNKQNADRGYEYGRLCCTE